MLAACLQALAPKAFADAPAEARTWFDAGVGASGAERWAEARGYFLRSIEVLPRAATYLNLAVTEVKLGLGREALASLDAFDRLADPTEHASMIERARVLRELAEQLVRDASAEPSPAVVASVPGESPAAPPSPVPEHAAVDKPTLAPVPSVEVPVPSREAPAPVSLRVPRLLLGAGSVLAGAAIGGAVWWRVQGHYIDECGAREPPCDNRSDLERERNGAVSLTLLAGVGALALIATGTVLLLRARRRADQTSVVWSPGRLDTAFRF